MGVPVTTHQWLKPLYDTLNGKGSRPLNFGSPTGVMGFYGSTGIARPTGIGASLGITGTTFFDARTNGGTGTQFYTLNDLVLLLKRRGDITT